MVRLRADPRSSLHTPSQHARIVPQRQEIAWYSHFAFQSSAQHCRQMCMKTFKRPWATELDNWSCAVSRGEDRSCGIHLGEMWDTGRLAAESPLVLTLRRSGTSPGCSSMLPCGPSGSAMPCCCSCTRKRASCGRHSSTCQLSAPHLLQAAPPHRAGIECWNEGNAADIWSAVAAYPDVVCLHSLAA